MPNITANDHRDYHFVILVSRVVEYTDDFSCVTPPCRCRVLMIFHYSYYAGLERRDMMAQKLLPTPP